MLTVLWEDTAVYSTIIGPVKPRYRGPRSMRPVIRQVSETGKFPTGVLIGLSSATQDAASNTNGRHKYARITPANAEAGKARVGGRNSNRTRHRQASVEKRGLAWHETRRPHSSEANPLAQELHNRRAG